MGFLARGLGMYARNPRLMLLGLLPAVITFALLVAAFIAVLAFADDAARWMTPYADSWSSELRETARAVITVAIVGVWAVLSLVLFTALTLLIGQPFYEAISKKVEDRLGGVPGGDIDVSFWRTLPRTIGENLRLVVRAALFAVVLFAIGLIPIVGSDDGGRARGVGRRDPAGGGVDQCAVRAAGAAAARPTPDAARAAGAVDRASAWRRSCAS